jgi:exonuclease SbcC
MQAEDVSEQLTTIEETILKLAEQEKIVEIGSKAEKLEFSITHAAEQLRLVYLKRNYRNGA